MKTEPIINLRSESIKRIIGHMPSKLLKAGAIIIVVLYIALFLVVFLLYYYGVYAM